MSLALALLGGGSAEAKKGALRISVSGADFQPYPIAVPPVRPVGTSAALAAPAQPLAAAATALLRQDVDLTRHFTLVPPNTYLAGASESIDRPQWDAWNNVGASGVIRANASGDGTRGTLDLRFFDVHLRKQAVARTCAVEGTNVGPCVHAFLDEVVALLTGEPGIFQTHIAFVRKQASGKSIFTCDLDGGTVTSAVQAGTLTLLPAWEANGTGLLFTSYLTGRALLYRQGLGATAPELVSGRRGLNVGAAVSPDGKRLALTLTIDNNAEIYVMDIDGRNAQRLTKSWGQDVSPAWSPDGKQLAFVSSRSGAPHLYVMDADGANQRRLTFQGTYNQEPDWSPRADGKIVFTARDERLVYDLFTVSPATGTITRLTQDAGDNDGPSFAPDGRHLVFTSTRGPSKRRSLYIMDEEGQKVRPIAPDIVDVETPAWSPRPKQ